MSDPNFSTFTSAEFRNHKSGATMVLRKASDLPASPENIRRVMEICNEPLVYDFLFRKRLQGGPYGEDMAKGFFSFASQGWLENTHFVFLILTAQGRIFAAVDIKSADLDQAEIGYWASSESSGSMTNAVAELCRVAHQAGYRSLRGLTLPENEKSAAVLLRNAFQDRGMAFVREKNYREFVKAF